MRSGAATTPRPDPTPETPAPRSGEGTSDPPGRAAYLAYRAGAQALRLVPGCVALPTAAGCGLVAGALGRARRRVVEANLRPVLGDRAGRGELARAARHAYADYGRYWADAARLDGSESVSLTFSGAEHLHPVPGRALVLALPHLGCWEVGGRWFAEQGDQLTTVVEQLRPPELLRWFIEERAAIGIRVLALGPTVATELLATLRQRRAVALLADRDMTGDGVDVRFFGQPTTLPGGPAMLALRSGAPLLACAVYHLRGGGHHAVVRPPLDTSRTGRIGVDVARVTQDLAHELERLIELAPSQWHVFQPRWGEPTRS